MHPQIIQIILIGSNFQEDNVAKEDNKKMFLAKTEEINFE